LVCLFLRQDLSTSWSQICDLLSSSSMAGITGVHQHTQHFLSFLKRHCSPTCFCWRLESTISGKSFLTVHLTSSQMLQEYEEETQLQWLCRVLHLTPAVCRFPPLLLPESAGNTLRTLSSRIYLTSGPFPSSVFIIFISLQQTWNLIG
jgi:hypothetical protein